MTDLFTKEKLVYFYIPGSESLNTLYFLAERYQERLVVITTSLSIIEICKTIGLKYSIPLFSNSLEKFNRFEGLKFLKKSKYLAIFNSLLTKSFDFYLTINGMMKAKRMVKELDANSILYHSTFFYDVMGILFLGLAIKSKKIDVRLISPQNFMKFGKIGPISFFTATFFINLLTSDLFAFHLDNTFGRVVGVNPEFLKKRKIEFYYVNEKFESNLPKNLSQKVISSLNLKYKEKKKVLFLGDYSVENSVSLFGSEYLNILSYFGELKGVETFFKPHPLYHSIDHPLLTKVTLLDVQIPVEFLDNGSWDFIIAFATAALISSKSSKCICLAKMERLDFTPSLNIHEFLKLLETSPNKIFYPKNIAELNQLLV